MIEWCLHTKPYTEDSPDESEDPESLLRYSPPSVDRFHLIDPHESIGEDIDDDEICYH